MDHSSKDKDSQSDVRRQADGGGNEGEGLGSECYISIVLSTWVFMSAPLSSSLSSAPTFLFFPPWVPDSEVSLPHFLMQTKQRDVFFLMAVAREIFSVQYLLYFMDCKAHLIAVHFFQKLAMRFIIWSVLLKCQFNLSELHARQGVIVNTLMRLIWSSVGLWFFTRTNEVGS